MFKEAVLKFYGGTSKTAVALGVTHSAVCQWGKIIPERQALKIDRISGGALKYDQSAYEKNTDSAA